MKKILLLLFCGFAATLGACKEDGAQSPDFRLFTPEVTDVDATGAAVSCRAAFEVEEYAGIRKGFVYGPAAQPVEQYAQTPPPAVSGNVMSCRLSGLTPGTDYRVCGFIDLGASRLLSEAAAFRTPGVSGDDPELEITTPEPLPVPAAGGRFTLTYMLTNPGPEPLAEASCASEWVHSFDNTARGAIAFTVDAAPGEARTAVIRVTYPGALPCEVTLRQAAADAPVEPTFGAPSHSSVTSTGATLRCTFDYTGDKPVTALYFLYAPTGGAERREAVSVQPGTKTVVLVELSAATTYTYHLRAEIGGATYSGAEASFTTAPGPVSGDTRFAGWAELPDETERSGDYYYAYHMRSDKASVRNFSVCYSSRYRCPVWVAAPMHRSFKGSARRRDRYINDPKISCTQNTEYKYSSTNLTRGHMLGSSDRTVSQPTNDQVFYKSNIGPQLQRGFNEGGGLWNNCEAWVDEQWVSHADTIYQVIGCWWENESEKVNGTTVPTHYYKVLLRTKNHVNKWVSNCTREELQCIAVFFPHNSSHKGTKPSQYESKGFLMTVSELEAKTGLKFFSNVPNAPKEAYRVGDWDL